MRTPGRLRYHPRMRHARSAVLGVIVVALSLVVGACDFATPVVDFGDGGVTGAGVIGFFSPSSTQDETSGAVPIDVILGAPSDTPIAVSYKFTGTAQRGTDFAAEDGTLVFEPGETKQAIVVEIINDQLEESDETIEITLSPPGGGARLGVAKHTLTISRNALPRVNFMVATSEDAESVGTKTIDLVLTQRTALVATVSYTLAGTAATGVDYTLAAGTVTFPAGTSTQTISLPITPDVNDEDNETVELQLSESTNIVIGTANKRTHTIDDDDDPPTVSIGPSAAVTEGSNPIPLLWNVAEVEVKLSVASGKTILVPIVNGAGTAQNNDYVGQATTLQFDPGETTKRVKIPIAGDATDEDDQTVISMIGTLDATKVTAGTPLSNTLTITDDDNPPQVRFGGADQMANEGDGGGVSNYNYLVEISAASEKPITFTVATGGAASTPGDYTAAPLTFAFNPGTTQSNVQISVVKDGMREPDEDIEMSLTTAGLTNATIGTPSLRKHRIRDDD